MISLFDLFSIGLGPSSSHTVGPMRAAKGFADKLERQNRLHQVFSLTIDLFGSLAMTGVGHGTDKALLLGLEGYTPEGTDPLIVDRRIREIKEEEKLLLGGKYNIVFSYKKNLLFHKGKSLPYHSNALRFKAYDKEGKEVGRQICYSVGGGFVVLQEEITQKKNDSSINVPYPFKTCNELQTICKRNQMMIYDVVMENEKSFRNEDEVKKGIFLRWQAMKECVARGCQREGTLPGGLDVKRRAPKMYRDLLQEDDLIGDPTQLLDWVSLFALAVNEENACGGRVVTAPTNGAAGIIPAVLHYYDRFVNDPTDEGIIRFFLTATAIGALYKEGASLSAAEMGCQGEVGVACSMAAGALTAALNGNNEQIENAAEIGMEHNLGLTCDPIGGLVQIPCIERNTMGAIKAINASRLALRGEGVGRVSLDQVISAMRATGEDMKTIYKETSEGGLAKEVSVAIPEC